MSGARPAFGGASVRSDLLPTCEIADMTIKPELLDLLRRRREKIINHIKPEKLEAMHAKGVLSARERIPKLIFCTSRRKV